MERTVLQGAELALTVGNEVRPQGIHTGLEGARPSYQALLYCALWADSGQGCAIQRQGEPFRRGWAASRDP